MTDSRLKINEYFMKIDALGWDPGLGTILELLRRLGNPQNQIPVVHVAGTNGKGSTLAFLSSIMESTGIQVGRFTSPAMIEPNGMITLNGVEISDDELVEKLEQIEKACEEMLACGFRHPTSFEVMTAVAFLYFRNKADLALIETGMGGRLDASNVVEKAKLCMITPIGMDHEAFLGHHLKDIAKEKAGIFRFGVPIVAAPQEEQVQVVLQEEAALKQAPLYPIKASDVWILKEGGVLQFLYQGQKYQSGMLGRHQAINAAMAIEAAKQLGEMGWEVTRENLVEGVLHAHWPGRFEVLRESPLLVLDGAHNAHGMRALNHARKQIFTGDYRAIVGVLGEKELGNEFIEILKDAKMIWTATPDNPRAMQAQALSKRLFKLGIENQAQESFEALVDLVIDEPEPCLIFGSLYLIGPLGQALKRRLQEDSCSNR
jgi:dihydrofolate synthase/folylpolyglutamate synthase